MRFSRNFFANENGGHVVIEVIHSIPKVENGRRVKSAVHLERKELPVCAVGIVRNAGINRIEEP